MARNRTSILRVLHVPQTGATGIMGLAFGTGSGVFWADGEDVRFGSLA